MAVMKAGGPGTAGVGTSMAIPVVFRVASHNAGAAARRHNPGVTLPLTVLGVGVRTVDRQRSRSTVGAPFSLKWL
jgi:hypothetical protein